MDIASLIVGFTFGVATVIGISLYLARKTIKKRQAKIKSLKNEVNDIMKKINNDTSLSDRVSKVKDLTTQQLELRSKAEGPQKNSLHGKHKNTIYAEIKEMEEEKNNILRSILGDGMDPSVAVVDEYGEAKTMKLSEYMEYMGISMAAEEPKPKKDSNFRNFTVYKGGKDTNNNSGKTE